MAGQAGLFDSDERLKTLSAAGDPLERLARVIDFEVFRGDLDAALSRTDRARGGRPPVKETRDEWLARQMVAATGSPARRDPGDVVH